MDAPAWSAPLLAEFVAAVSIAETGTAAAHAAVERAAEALDADVATLVFRTGRPARIDDLGEEAGPWVTAADVRSAVGVPISVEGRLWGIISVASGHGRPLSADTEARLAGFTELVATAIANAEAQAQLTASRARLVATADQTRLQIERDLHDGAQQRLVSLALQLRAPPLGELSAELGRVAAGLVSALDKLREYARGIYPRYGRAGLCPALKTLARQPGRAQGSRRGARRPGLPRQPAHGGNHPACGAPAHRRRPGHPGQPIAAITAATEAA